MKSWAGSLLGVLAAGLMAGAWLGQGDEAARAGGPERTPRDLRGASPEPGHTGHSAARGAIPAAGQRAPHGVGGLREEGATLGLPGGRASLVFRVWDASGRPREGVRVLLKFLGAAGGADLVVTGARGEARFGPVAAGSYAYLALAPGALERATDRVRVEHDQTLEVALRLAAGARVRGTVRSAAGEPLARVRVGLEAQRDRYVYSDAEGRYLLELAAREAESTLRFSLQGYEAERMAIPEAQASGERRLDVALRPTENAASFGGTVVDARGVPVVGAMVAVGSDTLDTFYQTHTNREGAFSVAHAKVGDGYFLRVLPTGPYRDYVKRPIRLGERGVSLEVVLESQGTGRLTGRMVDAEGHPLPRLRLWLKVDVAARSGFPIAGDERGYFELDPAPAGRLSFATRTRSPRLAVSGVTLPAGGERDVELVLDAGAAELLGEVVDERGAPIAGAHVSLRWSREEGDVRSISHRETRTDRHGAFGFRALGPGDHRVGVRAPGYRSVQEQHPVGGAAVEIRLLPDGP